MFRWPGRRADDVHRRNGCALAGLGQSQIRVREPGERYREEIRVRVSIRRRKIHCKLTWPGTSEDTQKKTLSKKDHQDEKIHLCETKRDDCGLRVSLTSHIAHGSLAGRYFGTRFQIRRQSSERVRREVKLTTSNLDP